MRDLEVRGAPDEFEAAVIAIVIDHITREETGLRARGGQPDAKLPAWVRAMPQLTPDRLVPATPDRR